MRRIYTVALFVVMASIDNTVLALLPTTTPRIREELGVSNQALGIVIALNLAIVALTGLFWGYRSDQGDRRRLLILGTLAWVLPVGLVPLTGSYGMFLLLMSLAGLGLGCISTVGYSIITDLVSERWRGFTLGVWGLAQGIGALVAPIVVGLLSERAGWRMPFGVMAAVGAVCSVLALFALSPRKGQADEALRGVAEDAGDYEYRIERADLPLVLRKPTNRWLMLQGFLAQFAYGSLTWLTALLTARLVVQGLELPRANSVAALLLVIFQVGGIVSLFWGWAGDRLQHRHPRARALLAAYGFWVALPCYLLLFWSPLPLEGTIQGSAMNIVRQQLGQNGWWWLAILGAALAVIAQSTNAPNWYAMVSEVNLPEHRGTAFSFVTLANNTGRALGAFLVGATFDWLQRVLAAPTNYAVGLSIFQTFFIPAGLCFWLAARTAPHDRAGMQATLRDRAGQTRAAGAPAPDGVQPRTSSAPTV